MAFQLFSKNNLFQSFSATISRLLGQIQSIFFIFNLTCILQNIYKYHPYLWVFNKSFWIIYIIYPLLSLLLISNWYFASNGPLAYIKKYQYQAHALLN